MSLQDGWAAIQLQMPERVPRVEFSITEYHWRLMSAVTGIQEKCGKTHFLVGNGDTAYC